MEGKKEEETHSGYKIIGNTSKELASVNYKKK